MTVHLRTRDNPVDLRDGFPAVDETYMDSERQQLEFVRAVFSSPAPGHDSLGGIYSLTKNFNDMAPKPRQEFLKELCQHLVRIFARESSAVPAPAFRYYVYFLARLTYVLQTTGAKDWTNEAKERCVRALCDTLFHADPHTGQLSMVDLSRAFERGLPDENYLTFYVDVAEAFLKTGDMRKDSGLRNMVTRLVAVVASRYHDVIKSTVELKLSELVRQDQKCSEPVAEILELLCQKKEDKGWFEDTRLAQAMIRKVEDMSADDAKNYAPFLEEFGARCPAVGWANLPLLVGLTDSPIERTRAAVLAMMGKLVTGSVLVPEKRADCDKLLDILTKRTMDQSSKVRCDCLDALREIVQQAGKGSFNVRHTVAIASVSDCVRDKTVLVRGKALDLFAALIEHVPMSFERDTYVQTLQTCKDKIEEKKAELGEDMQQEMDDWAGAAASSSSPAAHGDEGTTLEEEAAEQDARKQTLVSELRAYFQQMQLCCSFLAVVTHCEAVLGRCEQLLGSATITDVTHAMAFCKEAAKVRLPGWERISRSMFQLIWDARDGDKIKKELLRTFDDLYLAGGDDSSGTRRKSPRLIAHDLVELTRVATEDELCSMQQIIAEGERMFQESRERKSFLDRKIVQEVLSIALESHSEAAVRVLAMTIACHNRAGFVTELVDSVHASDVNHHKHTDSSSNNNYSYSKEVFRVLLENPGIALGAEDAAKLERHAVQVASGRMWGGVHDVHWAPAAEKALNCLNRVSTHPESRFEEIIRALVLNQQQHPRDEAVLVALFFVTGHVAVRLSVLADELAGDLKKLRAVKQQTQLTGNKSKNVEEDMIGANAEEDVEDLLLREVGLLRHDDSLLGSMRKTCEVLLEAHAAHSARLSKVLLQAVTLALCKFMSVSEQVCTTKNLSILFTLLRPGESDADVRSNIIISLGDLAFRFPNMVEPFIGYVYDPLSDDDAHVRKNTLMVLMYLSKNGMIKVRGEASEIACRLEDAEESIRDLAQRFFEESASTSQKGTSVFQYLPETLERLSQRGRLSPEKFRRCADFLIKFVDKDKECLQLAEKLCSRMHAASGAVGEEDVLVLSQLPTRRLCQELAYCLEKLVATRMTDAMRIKLSGDWFKKYYRPVLGDATIYQSFCAIAARASGVVAKTKDVVVTEWVEVMEQEHRKRAEDSEAIEHANGSRRAGGGAHKKKAPSAADRVDLENRVRQAVLGAKEKREEQVQQALALKKSKPAAKAGRGKVAKSRRRVGEEDLDTEEEE